MTPASLKNYTGDKNHAKLNLAGRILAYSVFSDNPGAALDLLEEGDRENNMFGKRDTYSNEYLIEQGRKLGLSLENRFGLRTFFGLSSNNEKNLQKNGMTTCSPWN